MNTTITYKGIEFYVEFDYQPAEAMVMYDADGSGYPGCPASIEGITKIEHKGTDFTDFFDDEIEAIEAAVWDSFID